MKVRAHVFVVGRVQGVNFRYFTRKFANKFSVFGWVKNLDDGRVEAIFEGEKETVDKMIEFCRKGPFMAKIDDVEVKWEEFTGKFKEFEIVY